MDLEGGVDCDAKWSRLESTAYIENPCRVREVHKLIERPSVHVELRFFGLNASECCHMCGADIAPDALSFRYTAYGRQPSEDQTDIVCRECWPDLRDRIDKLVHSRQ